MMVLTATSTLQTIISAIGDWITASVGWLAQIVGAVTATGNELLLIGFIVTLSAFCVHLFKSLVRV